MLRYRGPAQLAGIQIIHGNEGLDVFPERISSADLVILQRDFPRIDNAYDRVMAKAREEGKPVIYEIDDLLFELPDRHNVKAFHTDLLFSMMRALIEADAVTTSTAALVNYFRPFNPNTFLLNNYLNDKLWKPCAPQAPTVDQRPIVLGYMGSNNHLLDLEFVAPVLSSLLDRYGERLVLKFWGGEPPKTLTAKPNVEWLDFDMTNYAEFATFFQQQRSDVFLAPLSDSLFNRHKSAIKFMEYSAIGVAGVYSRLPPYQGVVEHGKNGFLAYTLDEWEQYLMELIDSPSLRHEMSVAAQQTVHQNWLLSNHAHEWGETYDKILSSHREVSPTLRQETEVVLRMAQQVRQRHTELEQRIQSLQNQLAEKEQKIIFLSAQVAATEQVVHDIFNSHSWRVAKKLGQLRLRLAPFGSLRERIFIRMIRLLGLERQ